MRNNCGATRQAPAHILRAGPFGYSVLSRGAHDSRAKALATTAGRLHCMVFNAKSITYTPQARHDAHLALLYINNA